MVGLGFLLATAVLFRGLGPSNTSHVDDNGRHDLLLYFLK